MNFENYIDDIVQLIESNINRINSRNILKNAVYSMSSENIFKLGAVHYLNLVLILGLF